MFSFLNPWVILGAIFTLIGVYSYGHHSGYQERVTEDQIEIARLNDEARTKEQALNEKIGKNQIALRKAKDELKSKQDSINARIDTSELRLPTSCALQAPTDTASSDGGQGGQSDRQAIKDIVTLTTEGDKAIIERNACIQQYNEVRDTINVKP
jgi:chromosome condensin MukBEF ATPase and DNA-binding subunit MukB